jgi:hypothetical protein
MVVGSAAGTAGAVGYVLSSARGVPGLAQTTGAVVELAVEVGEVLGDELAVELGEALRSGVASTPVSRLASDTPTIAATMTTTTATPMPI